jgi:uncharacterized protein (TIGR04141 family)
VGGAVALHLRLGVQPADLVSDLREIAAVCRQQAPHPDLAFVENITPVASKTIIADLTNQLDTLLGEATLSADRLTVAVPDTAAACHPRSARYSHWAAPSARTSRSWSLSRDSEATRPRGLRPTRRTHCGVSSQAWLVDMKKIKLSGSLASYDEQHGWAASEGDLSGVPRPGRSRVPSRGH